MASRGVYFLANDRLLDLVLAFLNSLRAHNPSIPVCFIPYDRNTARICALSASYRFSVLDDQPLLAWCDAISRQFHPVTRGHYRKIAAWHGPFDEFVYIDIDTVVLRAVDFVFPLLRDYDIVTAYSNDPLSRQFVWKDSILGNPDLTTDEIEYAANTGFIVSRKGLLGRTQVDQLVARARPLAPHMDLDCFEQPLLNYLMVKAASRRTSIWKLNREHPELNLARECWAGDGGWQIDGNGTCLYRGRPSPGLFVHWAGVMVPRPWEKRVYKVLSRLGLPTPHRRVKMPLRQLWRHYRYLHRHRN